MRVQLPQFIVGVIIMHCTVLCGIVRVDIVHCEGCHSASLPSYGQLEMVLEAAAAGGSGASKFLAAMKTISST